MSHLRPFRGLFQAIAFWLFTTWQIGTIVRLLKRTQHKGHEIMKLSKSDTKDLNIMLQHAVNGNMDTFERLVTSWIRNAPSGLVLAKRTAAISAVMGRIKSNQANA